VATSKKAQGSGGTRRPPARRAAAAPPRKRHWLRWTIVTVLGVVVLGIAVFAIALARTTVPSPNDLTTSEATVVYWADGRTELGRLGDSTRRSIPLSDVPLDVQHAVLAAEDRLLARSREQVAPRLADATIAHSLQPRRGRAKPPPVALLSCCTPRTCRSM